MNEGLLRMCRDALIPEPISVTQDKDGRYHLASQTFPLRALIDPAVVKHYPWVDVDAATATVSIKLAAGKTAVYRRRAYEINGAWDCDLD